MSLGMPPHPKGWRRPCTLISRNELRSHNYITDLQANLTANVTKSKVYIEDMFGTFKSVINTEGILSSGI